MTVFTSRWGFQWNWQPGDNGWGTSYNFVMRELAAVLHPYLVSDTVDTPPGSASEGDAYFVPTTATGAWATQTHKLAVYEGGTWQYYTPEQGTRCFVVSRGAFYWWNGTTFAAEVTSGGTGSGVQTVAGHAPDISGNISLVVGDITGAAPLSSAALTGIPTAPTAPALTRNLQLATTAYVDNAVTNAATSAIPYATTSAAGVIKVGTTLTISSGVLDVDTSSFATTTSVSGKVSKTGDTMTGALHVVAPGSTDNTDIAVSSAWVQTYVSGLGFGTGSGTVTSVGLSLPSDFSVSSSPVTGAGTLTVARTVQNANLVMAGPASGAAAVPTYRALIPADMPAEPYVISAFYLGVPGNSQLLLVHRCAKAITFGSNFSTTTSGASTGAGCTVNATSSTVISVDKCLAANDPTVDGNWTQIGTLTIGAGGHSATLATVSGTSKSAASGDFLRAVGPATADATAANIFVTLAADR